MFRLRPKLTFIIPALLAVGLLFGLPLLPPLVQGEHLAFLAPERFKPDTYFLENREPESFDIRVLDFHPSEDPPTNIGTYLIDAETQEIMGPNGGDPIEWAQFLRQTRLSDDRLLVITSSLSWQDATELPLQALQQQVNKTPHLVVGLRAELLNTEEPLPVELQNSVITEEPLLTFTLPEVDRLAAPPSITAPLFGISEVRGLKIEKIGDAHRLPMLIRWGNHILPSLHLASLITTYRLRPSEVQIDERGYLRLGDTGPILKIDTSGFTLLPTSESDFQSASKLQIYPSQAETTKIIALPDSPLWTKRFTSQLRQALGQKPQLVKTYTRWSLPVEIALLVILSLILNTSRPWLFIPVAIAIPLVSLSLSHWPLIAPILLLGIIRLTFRKAYKWRASPADLTD